MSTVNLTLNTLVSNLPLVGPAYAARLAKMDIKTVRDLLYHVPARYNDFSNTAKIASVQEGETITIQGKVVEMKNIFTKRGLVLQEAVLEDETGQIKIIWFNQRFLTSTIRKGDQISLSGKVSRNGARLQMESPDYEIIYGGKPPLHTGRLVPVYPETAGLSSKWLRHRINFLLGEITSGQLEITETLDKESLNKHSLMGLPEALTQVHFPDNPHRAQAARRRLAFDELLFSQLESRSRKREWQQLSVGKSLNIEKIQPGLDAFTSSLPFTLTPAQQRVTTEILQDLGKKTPMNRLLQGDVGSGKTVVAAISILAALRNGLTAAFMAPTEILARQHFETLKTLLGPLGVKIGIATGSQKDYTGSDVIVGTHALLSSSLNINNLGLVVIDEQHRFGVTQRAKLTAKGKNPHLLTMTATPIPRTVALTLYGDLDISILDEMPADRLPVKTWVVPEQKRDAAYQWIREQRTQTFIICPLIEQSQSETLTDVRAAKKEFDHLKTAVFPDLKLGLLHGRLSPSEKERVLSAFRAKELDVLVSTPVIEVGIDIPAASVMVIEAAERFGLAQLHQLRGRVGRGDRQSFCLLFSENESAFGRLKQLESLDNGLKLAEIDLSYRGPGQRFGLAQHGRWELKIADFSDFSLIEASRRLAEAVSEEPEKFPLLRRLVSPSKITSAPN